MTDEQIIERNRKIDRLKAIKEETDSLKAEKDRLEGELIADCKSELENTKNKTFTCITESGTSATFTMADNLVIDYPSRLKLIFGNAYEDLVETETKYTIKPKGKQILIDMFSGKYTENVTLEQAINQLPTDERTLKKLEKKLKGKKFDTDKKNLMNIGGFSEDDASDYAYLLAEAANWQEFETMLKLSGITDKQGVDEILNLINSSVHVETQEKLSVK